MIKFYLSSFINNLIVDDLKTNLEGKGFCPGYWANDEDMKQTLIDLTGDKEMEYIFF